MKALHCTKKTPTKRTTPETATFVAVFAFSGNLHATCNKACPFAFSTKSEYKRRFFVVPAYVLQCKVFCTVVLFLFDLATVSRPQKPSALDLSTFYFTSALGIAKTHGTGKAHYRSLIILHFVQKNPARKDRIFAYGVSFCFL